MSMHASDAVRTPALVAPTLRPMPWGGRRLATMPLAADVPPGPIGEAWLAGPESRVLAPERGSLAGASGAGPVVAGATLAELARAHGRAFVGREPFERYGARMPLLVKLLDAAAPLSVQVHPDDAYAERHEAETGYLGKTEVWYVLDAESEATVLWGFGRPVMEAEVRAAVADGRLESLLRRVPVRAGDVVLNRAGVVHAVGAGVLLYELQQASDLTYRLYDYDRRGADGRPRPLHLEQALAVARLTPEPEPSPARELAPGRTRLADTHAFSLERWAVGRGGAPSEQSWVVEPRSLEVWTLLEGEATLGCDAGALALAGRQSVVLPAGVGAATWWGEALLLRGRA